MPIFRLSILFLIFLISNISILCADALPSWSNSIVKQKIVGFVEKITRPNTQDFVPIEERIAVFDNDGTMWVEKPFNTQLQFTLNRAAALAKQQPSLAQEQPFKAILENDHDYLQHLSREELTQLMALVYGGMTEDAFIKEVNEFLNSAKDERFNRPFTQLIYQPMLELMNYLRSKNFKVYICTGGGNDFVRTYSEKFYTVPPEQVIGTAIQMSFQMNGNIPTLMRLHEIVPPVNVRGGKAVNIQRYIGRKPIIAVGNSDGDIEMLQFTDNPKQGLSLEILVHHDDEKREYAYDKGTEEALKVAKERNWVIVSMKNDFSIIFPFERK